MREFTVMSAIPLPDWGMQCARRPARFSRDKDAPFALPVRYLWNCPPTKAKESWRTLEASSAYMGGMQICFQTLELKELLAGSQRRNPHS